MPVPLDHAEDDARGLRLAWALSNLPAVGLTIAGGMLHAFARSAGSAPMPASQRRAIVDSARRVSSRPAGGAR